MSVTVCKYIRVCAKSRSSAASETNERTARNLAPAAAAVRNFTLSPCLVRARQPVSQPSFAAEEVASVLSEIATVLLSLILALSFQEASQRIMNGQAQSSFCVCDLKWIQDYQNMSSRRRRVLWWAEVLSLVNGALWWWRETSSIDANPSLSPSAWIGAWLHLRKLRGYTSKYLINRHQLL